MPSNTPAHRSCSDALIRSTLRVFEAIDFEQITNARRAPVRSTSSFSRSSMASSPQWSRHS